MDAFSAFLTGYGTTKALDALFAIGRQRRALKCALGRAWAQFKDDHADVVELILATEAWKLLLEDLALLITANRQPDPVVLARRIAEEDLDKATRLQGPLTQLIRRVQEEAALEPKLVDLQTFRATEQVLTRIAGIERALGVTLDIQAVLADACEATKADIHGFTVEKRKKDLGLRPPLRYFGEDGSTIDFELHHIAGLLSAGQRVVLEGLPGYGKSTAMLQLAGHLVSEHDDIVPLFVPLPEWSIGHRDFLEEIESRRNFSALNLTAKHIQFLAENARIVLLLDGWNELTGEKLETAHHEVIKFAREYPTTGILVSMRPTVQKPPLRSTHTIKMLALGRQQRDEVIRSRLGCEAEDVVDQIRMSRDLDEITRIPLYLTTFLEVTTAGFVPRSREELLRSFIGAHERNEEHTLKLSSTFEGLHGEYLQDLAVEMLRRGGPALSAADCATVISQTGRRLVNLGHLESYPNPGQALSTLAGHHLLVSNGEPDSLKYSYQHHQFQEWFASQHVEQLTMKAIEVPEGVFGQQLREQIIDIPLWEEPVFFALERLAGEGAPGEAAAAFVIVVALRIDPMLAAELIYRSGENVWLRVKDSVLDFARRWHRESSIDRALGFMIATGRPEFSETVWPYLIHEDKQVRLGASRTAEPFRPGVLGPNWSDRLSEVSEEAQIDILRKLIFQGGFEGTQLATEAAAELSTEVKIHAIEALEFQHARSQITKLLSDAPDPMWKQIALRARLDKFEDETITNRVVEETRKLARSAPHGIDRIRLLLRLIEFGIGEAKIELVEEFKRPEFEADKDYAVPVFESAASIDSAGVSSALIHRLLQGLPINWHAEAYLLEASEQEKRRLLDLIVRGDLDRGRLHSAAPLLGEEQVARLVERFLETASAISSATGPISETQSKQYQDRLYVIGLVDFSALLDVILSREPATTVSEIDALAHLLSRHGRRSSADDRLPIPDRLRGQVQQLICQWVDLLVGSPAGNRVVMSSVSHLLERVGGTENLSNLVRLTDHELDLNRKDKQAFREWEKAGRRGPQPEGAHMGTALSYRRAFQAVPGTLGAEAALKYLDDPEFGDDAAQILRYVGQREAGLLRDGQTLSPWPDFSRIKEKRRERSKQVVRPEPHPYAAAILDAVRDIMSGSPSRRDVVRAIQLCGAASGLEYGSRLNEIIQVLELSDFHQEKIGCFLNLILGGEELSVDLIEPGFESVFKEWHKKHWHTDGDWWPVKQWLVLLALSDDPESVLARVDSLGDDRMPVWDYQQIVEALGANPCPRAGTALIRLGEGNPELRASSLWIKVLAQREEKNATEAIMSILWDPYASDEMRRSHSDTVIAPIIADRLSEDDELRSEFSDRLREKLEEPVRRLALHVVQHMAGGDMVIAALEQLSDKSGDPVPFHLRESVKYVVTKHVPVEGWISAYSVEPANASRLRATLFAMAYDDPERHHAAQRLLEWTDELRDEYGRPDDEPRHPNIQSGRQWPMNV